MLSIPSHPPIIADGHPRTRIVFSRCFEKIPCVPSPRLLRGSHGRHLSSAAISNACFGGSGGGVGHPLDATIFVNILNVFECKIHHLFPLLGVSDLIGLTIHIFLYLLQRIWAEAGLPFGTTNITKLSSANASGTSVSSCSLSTSSSFGQLT